MVAVRIRLGCPVWLYLYMYNIYALIQRSNSHHSTIHLLLTRQNHHKHFAFHCKC